MPPVVRGKLANGVFPTTGSRWSDPVATFQQMLGVALVEDPLAVRKLGEVQVAAEIHFGKIGP
jgi:hypothetical protein